MIFLLQAAAVSAGLSMINAAPALATWGEGSEPGQNIDPAGRPQEFLRWIFVVLQFLGKNMFFFFGKKKHG